MDEDWLDRFVADQLPIIIFTRQGTWYAGPILDRTPTTLTLEVTAYKRTGVADPIKVFPISEIMHLQAAEGVCEICGTTTDLHTNELCFK